MNAVNLVILLENVVCVLVHEHWGVEGAEVLPLAVAVEVPVMMVMGAGTFNTLWLLILITGLSLFLSSVLYRIHLGLGFQLTKKGYDRFKFQHSIL